MKLAEIGLIALLGVATPLVAARAQPYAPLDSPVPSGAYIVFNGLDWAWGDSISTEASADLSYQGSQGWRIPSTSELDDAPLATDFLVSDGNVPYSGVDPISKSTYLTVLAPDYTTALSPGACAAGYFSKYTSICDFADGDGEKFGPWAGTNGMAQGYSDQLFVRNVLGGSGDVSAAPEPGGWGLTLVGLFSIGLMMRRRNQSSSFLYLS